MSAMEIEAGPSPPRGNDSAAIEPWYRKPKVLAAIFVGLVLVIILVKVICSFFGGPTADSVEADLLKGIGTQCTPQADECPENLECIDGSCQVRESILMDKCGQLIKGGSVTSWSGDHGPEQQTAIIRNGKYAGLRWCGCQLDAPDAQNQREIQCNSATVPEAFDHFIGHSRVNARGLRHLWKEHPPTDGKAPSCRCVKRPRKDLGEVCETHEQCKEGDECRAFKGHDQNRVCKVGMKKLWANCDELIKGSVKWHSGTDWNENGAVEQGGCQCSSPKQASCGGFDLGREKLKVGSAKLRDLWHRQVEDKKRGFAPPSCWCA